MHSINKYPNKEKFTSNESYKHEIKKPRCKMKKFVKFKMLNLKIGFLETYFEHIC